MQYVQVYVVFILELCQLNNIKHCLTRNMKLQYKIYNLLMYFQFMENICFHLEFRMLLTILL